MTNPRPTLSLCAWACNEESIVAEFVHKTLDDLARVSDDFELIVVDDGSTDATLANLQELQKTCPALRVVSHGRNLGYGACFRTTLAMASKDVVLWNTVDMFFDTRDLPNFLRHLNQFDLVQGVRTDLEANHARGKLATTVNYWTIRLLFGIPMSEFQNVKVLKRTLLDGFTLEADTGFVNAEIGIKAHYGGARIVEVAMEFHPRRGGEAKGAPVRVLVATLLDIGRLWFRWVILRRVPRAAVRHRVTSLTRRSWGKPGFLKGQRERV